MAKAKRKMGPAQRKKLKAGLRKACRKQGKASKISKGLCDWAFGRKSKKSKKAKKAKK